MKKIESKFVKGFRSNFQKRMKYIAREINPVGYAQVDAFGFDDPDGPQIFGEMIEYLKRKV